MRTTAMIPASIQRIGCAADAAQEVRTASIPGRWCAEPVAGSGQALRRARSTDALRGVAVLVLCAFGLLLSPSGFAANTQIAQLERWKPRDAAAREDGPAVNTKIHGPGDYWFTLEHGGLTRKYRVHIPASYSPSKPAPMLLAFHGGGANMDYEADDKYYGLISKSEEIGYIAVFPNGYSPLPSGKLATWNAGNCCAGARDRNIDDVGFVREMVSSLKKQLNVDPKRIYATGMSNGALFSHRLACELSDVISAIASVAGSDGTSVCSPSRPVSILEIHAKDDEFVLFNGGAGKKSRTLANFVSVPETVSRWVRRNACNTTPRRVLETAGAYCDAYTQCRGNVEVRLCVTETGGHSWPGGRKIRNDKAGSTAISATNLMWEFFNAH